MFLKMYQLLQLSRCNRKNCLNLFYVCDFWKSEDFQFAFHILCIGSDKIGHDFRNFLKLFFEVQKDIKKDARISPDTIVTEPIFMSFHFTISPCLFKYATFDEIYKLEVSDFFFRYSLSHGFPHDRNNLRSPDAPAGLCHKAFHYPQRHNHTS